MALAPPTRGRRRVEPPPRLTSGLQGWQPRSIETEEQVKYWNGDQRGIVEMNVYITQRERGVGKVRKLGECRKNSECGRKRMDTYGARRRHCLMLDGGRFLAMSVLG